MRKVLITGANGFIGTALCKELSINGIEIIAIVKDAESDISSIKDIPNLKVVYCELEDIINLDKYIKDRDIDVLYHLAWMGSSGPNRGNCDVQVNNIKYTCDTVKVCANLGCRRIVFAASIMEYELQAMIENGMKIGINSLYSSAKLAADYMAQALAEDLGVDYIRAVISNVYGPGENNSRLINTSLRKMIKGEHCKFSSGEQMYDFIYISDAAKAFLMIGEKGLRKKTYYVGSQNPRPLKEFLYQMGKCIEPTVSIKLGEIKDEVQSLTYCEFDKDAVKNDTGFVPVISFSEGIKRTVRWIKEKG